MHDPAHDQDADAAESELLVSAWRARKRLYEDLFGNYKYTLPKVYQAPKAPTPGTKRAMALRSAIDEAMGAESSASRVEAGDEGLAEGSDECPAGSRTANDRATGAGAEAAAESTTESTAESIRTTIASVLAGVQSLDPKLAAQRVAILVYPPEGGRTSWMYVTSGLSNPWFAHEPDVVSGFGVELVVKTSRESRWPIRLLRRLSQYVLSYSGTLSPGVMLNMASPINGSAKSVEVAAEAGKPEDLSNILVWYADEAPDAWYQLPSGGFGLFCVIGITEGECSYGESANQYGVWCVQQVLRAAGVGQLTDPGRPCVASRQDIDELLNEVRTYAEHFCDPEIVNEP